MKKLYMLLTLGLFLGSALVVPMAAVACSSCGCSPTPAASAAPAVDATCPTGACGTSVKVEKVIKKENHGHDHGYALVNTFKMKELIDSKEKIIIVDARTGKYDDGRRLPGALALPADATDKMIASVIPSKDAKVVAYCTNLKCPASAKLAERLVKMGYKGIHKYPDGIDAWEAAGGEITTVKK